MKRCIVPRLSLLLVFFLLAFMPARAQQMIKPPADSPETNVSERVRLLESELERQNTKLDQLKKPPSKQRASFRAPRKNPTARPGGAPLKKSGAPAPAEPQTPTIEQPLAKVESQALKIGPVRL